jgi:hypothetical protein
MRIITDEIPIIVDTREQRPYTYPGSTTATLTTGDYSVAGLTDRVAVERKSLSDLLGCVGRDRDRFREQVARLGALEAGHLVVEASMSRVLEGHELSSIQPAAALNTLICGSRAEAKATVYRILQHFVRLVTAEIDVSEEPPVSCRRCNRPLRDPQSRRKGVGPVCEIREVEEGAVPAMQVVA